MSAETNGNGENGKKSLVKKIKENFNFTLEVNWGAFHLSANATALLGGSLIISLIAFLVELFTTLVKRLLF